MALKARRIGQKVNESPIPLINQAINGDERACRQLLNLYKGKIFSYIFRLVQNYHDAEDLTYETFIKCFNSLNTFRQDRSFKAWLFTIAHNTAMDFFRKHRQNIEYLDDMHSVPDAFVEECEKTRKFEKLEAALARLNPQDREIVILFHYEEHSYDEISRLLDMPVSTIKTRLHRARLKLRDIVTNL